MAQGQPAGGKRKARQSGLFVADCRWCIQDEPGSDYFMVSRVWTASGFGLTVQSAAVRLRPLVVRQSS